ncbi:glycosyl hydrolase [Silicimonas algicola]|uniref:Putative neuraminidase n=1 Tax=Silicimonas algicola TaxID=1826607 RepID=A0A316G7A7_9RHOB|nr:exo-alpha-sialidase [Silicimonas algicola]AZQ68470.1 glycosyl hydrolase [Silicimonas algicola]PWK55826.1 putative neuraminidase [Silicimonas algicola]
MSVLSPEMIADRMNGRLVATAEGREEALLPSPCIQNHAAFLSHGKDALHCLWFGGSLEGKSDISIWRSTLRDGLWSPAEQISDDPARSEQNPVQFDAPDGRRLILHTAQEGGNQDACLVRMREAGAAPVDLDLPKGTFIRGPIRVRGDGAWLLPLFRCVPRPGERWTGSHDTAAVAISTDAGTTWREVEVPDSIGSVHMTLVPLGGDRFAAFYRRRQADFVHRSESDDGGETWSAPKPTDVPNNNSSLSAIALSDGRVAMACNPANAEMHPDARRASLYDELGEGDDRPNASGGCKPIWGVPRAPMTLCFSTDGGRTFPKRILVEDGSGTCLTNNSVDGQNHEMSYPSLVEGPEGTLDLAYTYFRRAIKHVRMTRAWLDAQ